MTEGSNGKVKTEVIAELIRQASNFERYPYESATMAEAARMAANALRRIARRIELDAPERSHTTPVRG